MRVRTKDGKTVEVSGSYGLRLIEQGKAVAAPGGRTPAEGTTTGGTATAGREGTLTEGNGTQADGFKSANAPGGRTPTAGTARKTRQAEAPAKAGRGEKTAGVEDGAERPNQ